MGNRRGFIQYDKLLMLFNLVLTVQIYRGYANIAVGSIPVVAIGGSATVEDFGNAIKAGASAVSAGSQFVFQRPHRIVRQVFAKETSAKQTQK